MLDSSITSAIPRLNVTVADVLSSKSRQEGILSVAFVLMIYLNMGNGNISLLACDILVWLPVQKNGDT
jgi:hypothetical protein